MKRYLKIILSATFLTLAFRFLMLETFRVDSSSMLPNLKRGDILFVSKLSYGIQIPLISTPIFNWAKPNRGDLILLVLPEKNMESYLKRVIAIEGDELEIKEGRLWLNKKEQLYENSEKGSFYEFTEGRKHGIILAKENLGPILIPKKHCFVLGDNRPESLDSRTWGPISFDHVRGKVKWVWSFKG